VTNLAVNEGLLNVFEKQNGNGVYMDRRQTSNVEDKALLRGGGDGGESRRERDRRHERRWQRTTVRERGTRVL